MKTELFEMVNRNHDMAMAMWACSRKKERDYGGWIMLLAVITCVILMGFAEGSL